MDRMDYEMLSEDVQNRGKQKVFLSIIVPIYNIPENYFQKCMDSLVNQTLSEIEIILVDDGSRIECADKCDELASQDSRIRVLHQANQGVSVARNNGIAMAKGDWITFVDADDWVELDAYEKLYKELISNPCDILLFDHIKEYSNGIQVRRETGLINKMLYSASDAATKEMLYRRAMGTPNLGGINQSTIYYSWDKLYRRNFIQKNNLIFPIGLPKSEDKVFILECFEKVESLLYINEAFYHYRLNEDSATYKYSPQVVEERRVLSNYLEEIARRMDSELAKLTDNLSYNLIYKDYMRFVFGIISNILFSKYYHKNYEGSNAQRRDEVKKFLKSEPFHTAIKFCEYKELGTEAKVKKFMLKHGMTTLFCKLINLKKKLNRQIENDLR